MKNTGLVSLLKTLSNEEMKNFRRFVNSPFHNRRNDVTEFFEILKNYYPKFDDKKFTNECIFSKLYPDKEYDNRVIRRLTSFLMKIAEEYLSYIRFKSEDFYPQIFLIEELKIRNLYSLAEKELNKIDKEYEHFKGAAETFFLKKYFIKEEKINYYIDTNRMHLLTGEYINYTSYFVYDSLIKICQNHFNLFVYEKEIHADFKKIPFYEFIKNINIEKILEVLKKEQNEFYPIIAIHYYELMSLIELDNEEYVSKFKGFLRDDINKFTWLGQRNFYFIFVSICTLKIERGNLKYRRELFEAYKEMLKRDLCRYSENGYFNLKLFRNIIPAGVFVKKFDWLEDFVEKYSKMLPPESKDNMHNLSRAIINYEKGNYEDALENISKVNFDIFQYKIDVKFLTLKIYYELDLYEQLVSFLDTYKRFIISSKVMSERVKDVYLSFANIVGKLSKIKINQTFEDLVFVKKDVKELSSDLNRNWLLEKIKELEGKGKK